MSIDPNSVRNIVFDLGGVLIDWNPRYLYSKVFSDPDEMEHFLNYVCDQSWNEMQDCGRPFAEAIQLNALENPEYKPEIEMYYSRWSEMIKGGIEENVQILKELSGINKYRLLALTNWSHETFGIAQEQFDFLKLFEGIVVSGEVKMIKPDPRIFEHLCSRFEISPSESIFIDDSIVNIESAAKLKFLTHHYRDTVGLRRFLQPFMAC